MLAVPVPAGGHLSRPGDRRTCAGRPRADRRQHGAAGGDPLALDRAGRREQKFLQRSSCLFLHRQFRLLAAYVIHRLASERSAVRRPGTADFRTPTRSRNIRPRVSPSPCAGCSAISCFAHASSVDMPPPGDIRPARYDVELDRFRMGGPLCAAHRRREQTGDLAEPHAIPHHSAISQPGLRSPGLPASGSCVMGLIFDLSIQISQMLVVLLLAPLLTGFIRKAKARLLRRHGPPLLQPYLDLVKLARKEVVVAESASWLFRVAPYIIFADDLGGGRPGSDIRHRPAVQLVGGPDRHHRAARKRAVFSRSGRNGCRHEFRRHRLQPRDDVRHAGRAGADHDRVHAGPDRRLHPIVDRRRIHAVARRWAAHFAGVWR